MCLYAALYFTAKNSIKQILITTCYVVIMGRPELLSNIIFAIMRDDASGIETMVSITLTFAKESGCVKGKVA